MKKLLTLIALFAMTAPVFAADKYASVDIDKVLKGYKKTATINQSFQKQEADLRVFIVDAQKEVVGATTEADRKKLEEKYGKMLQAKMDKLQKDKLEALKSIETDIKKAIDTEGRTGTYALILTNNNALYGTFDISDKILKSLNGN